jgi:FtsP/CotA-like multicopper oxidase with cupredoxin domain
LTYRIKIRDHQSGTFWYHSHFETQRADGLYGPLVVHNPATSGKSELDIHGYVDDQVLMIGDWYHRSAVDVLDQYDNWKSFKIEPAPDSILLNGKGFFDCSMAVPARPVDCSKIRLPHMKLPFGRSRLRIVNTGSLTGITMSMTGHYLELIKLDGGNDAQTTAAGTEIGILYPGERMDIIVDNIDDSHTGGRITVALDQENIRNANQALRPTQQFPISSPSSRRIMHHAPSSKQNPRDWTTFINVAQSNGVDLSRDQLPREAEKTFVLYATMSYLAINSNRPKGYINHTTWTVSERYTPLLALDRARWPSDPGPFIPTTDTAEWIDIVLNNMDDKGHPFHLHGYDFYILSRHAPSRVGSYELLNPFDTTKTPAGGPMNLINPPKKDTVYVPSMGYVVLRFHANNPGLWLLHCHILWHQSVGMGMAFQVEGSSSKDTWLALRKTAQDSCRV